jgi:amino acid adenylation domain-containing protein
MLTEAQLEELTARLRRGRESPAREIPRRPAGLTDLPLSYGQEQLWFIDRLAPGMPTYNIPYSLGLSGPLDCAALSRAYAALAERHESLRTRLVPGRAGRPAQLIDPPGQLPLELTDLSALPPQQRQAELREFVRREGLRPFALADQPLLRAWLLRLAPGEHVLVVVVHHSVFDGWSRRVFVRELAALYAAEVTPATSGSLQSVLPELPVQFADYAIWERNRLAGPALDELEAHWRGVLDGLPIVQFPTDRPRPMVDNFDGALAQRETGPELLDGLRALSRREGTTLFVTLMTGLLALLHRYTGQTDLVVGTASANRGREELAPLIGYLVNALPIRADLSGDPPFTELLARVKEATVSGYAHQDLPFGRLVETLQVERDPSRSPVFQLAMTYTERDETPVSAAGVDFLLSGADLVVNANAARFDLDFATEASSEGLKLACSFKTGLFDAGTIERLLANWEVLLRGAVTDPSVRLSRLPVLTEAELHRELTEWNDTAAQFPVRCVHEAVQAQVTRTPDAVAAQFELGADGQRLTYAQLNARANQIARRLRAAGAGPEILVGVCMATGLDRLAGVLGIWKAGSGYVPLDPGLPADRLSFMIADTGMKVILTDEASAASLPPADGVAIISLDAERDLIGKQDEGDLDGTGLYKTGVAPDNVAYVIYTSGSTGEPKGVVVEHRQAVNFLQGMVAPWRAGPGSVVLAFAAFTFDVSVCDMFLPLIAGARLVLAARQTLHSPPRLTALMREAGVTYAMLPPAVLSLLNGQDFPALRTLISTGEELVSELVQPWLRDGLEFWNGYGPTEATMGSTFMKLDASTPLPPPIGRPKPNYRAYVLDPDLNVVPTGVIGELHIGGPGVSRGYLNRPELTKEKFIPDPFSAVLPGARLYKTGDLVRRRPDGTIVFAGRIDDQVKIRGLRVELGEIETALLTHPAVAQAVVTVIADQSGEPQLAAYLRAEGHGRAGQGEPDLAEVRRHLAGGLPGYMVPAYLTVLDEFPLTANGKVDRAALPAPQAMPAAERVAPATLIEVVMTDMFARLLNLEDAGATDSFFDLGGNSLQAMRLIGMMGDELRVDIGAVAVFLAPTPRQLAALLRDKHGLPDTELGAGGVAGLGQLAGQGSEPMATGPQ